MDAIDAEYRPRRDKPAHIVFLSESKFHYQPAAVHERTDRRVEHGLDASQPVLPAEERDVRLMADVTRQRRFVPVFDVRWIGGDQIEWTCYAVEK